MSFNLRKNRDSVIIFLVALSVGLVISYTIRLLSRPSSCRHKSSIPPTENSPVSITPDQIVNLNFIRTSHQSGDSSESEEANKWSSAHESRDGTNPRKLLLVGVMTASLFLETRAKAVWETWGKDIPGKIIFFTGGNSYNEKERKSLNDSFPLVILPEVEDTYPPQKKSFMMIKYMYENFGEDYEWFMRADDDVFVRGEKLSDFLRSIDSRHLYFIGQAGKGNQVEKGTLNLANDENFCMGGPGIILSRPTLKMVAPNVNECLKVMYSTHEDVELGRCVKRFAKVSCTWAYEMQTVFHHNSSGDHAFTGNLKRREVHKAITLHPIKNYQHLYRLHLYFQGQKIQELLYRMISLSRDIVSVSQFISRTQNNASDEKPPFPNINKRLALDSTISSSFNTTGQAPSLNKYLPSNHKDVISWQFLGKGVYSMDTISPKSKLKGDGREALEDVVREVMDVINGYSRSRGRVVEFKEILYGYKRVNPMHGADYILDLLMTYKKYRGRKMTIPVRRHVYAQRPFGPLQIRAYPKISQHSDNDGDEATTTTFKLTKMVMIVPLSGRYEVFGRFLENFSNTCLDLFGNLNSSHHSSKYKTQFELSLVVVFFGSDDEKEKFLYLVQKKRDSLSNQQQNGEEPLCKITMVQIDGVFSRGIALETGISQCNDEDMLFLIDVDLTFNAEVLRRVDHNTLIGKQAYFPIVFSQYNPEFYTLPFNHSHLSSDFGYFRQFGFGIASFYKSDFRQSGGFDTSIKGWGKEDVSLFDRFLQHTNLKVFRAPDPQLVHIFHETKCDTNLTKSQLEMCFGSQANTLGSQQNLMRHLIKTKGLHFRTDN